jgi:hypothetical protein
MKWLPADLALVSVFALIGRWNHDEPITWSGWWETAWPFLAAALVGWVVVVTMRWPGGSIAAGAAVWACAWVGGLLLRRASDEGTAAAFVVVAGVVLGVLLVGTRAANQLRLRAGG